MSRLIPAFEQFFDSNGKPLKNGLIDFFESGSSSVRKTTFADSGEKIANSNPVVLNGDGRCPNVFGSGTHRAVLKDSDGNQILQRDPVGGDQNLAFGADWNPTQIYSVSDVVRDSGLYWESSTNNNLNNKPSTDSGINWRQAFLTETQIVNAVGKVYENVAAMVDDNSLSVGQFIRTEGYSVKGDGGGNDYEVVAAGTGTDDGGSFIDLATHQAKALFPFGKINVKQFGAKGDKANNDTSFIQAAIDFVYKADAVINRGVLEFPEGSYLVDPTVGLVMKDNLNMAGAGFGSCEIIASSTSATTRAGYTDGLIRRPFTAAPGNERIQYIRIDGFRFVIRGDNQTMINLGHMGRSLCRRNRITVQDRTQEFSNLPQTIFAGSKGIVIGVADSLANGYAGGEVCTVENNIIEFAATAIDLFGPVHATNIIANDLLESRLLINVPSTASSGGTIRDNTIQNIRDPGGSYCIDLSGFNWTIEGNYFEPTTDATGQILLRSSSKGNYVGQNRFDTVVSTVTDDGTGNKYPSVTEAQTQNTMCGVSHTSFYEGTRITSNQVLSTVGATALIFNQEDLNKVDNSTTAGQAINPNTATNGTYFAPFDGVYHYSLSVKIDPAVDTEVQLLASVGGTNKKVHQSTFLAAGATYQTFSGSVMANKNDGIAFSIFPLTVMASLELVQSPDVTVTIAGVSES